MLTNLLALFAMAIAVLLTALMVRFGARLGLMDYPNHRSSHHESVPRGGGLPIVAASLAAVILNNLLTADHPASDIDPGSRHLVLISLLAGLPIAMVGALDDWRGVPARLRLLTQVIVVTILLLLLAPLPGFLIYPGFALPSPLLWIGLMIFGVAWINFHNFMDGIDGLAASQAIFILVAASVLGLIAGVELVHDDPIRVLMLCTAGATAGFLVLNWAPARIFMGDVGSTWLGFMIFAFAIITTAAGWMNFATWLILGAPFVVDASVTLLTRICGGEPWHLAHRSHAYQRATRALEHHGHSRTSAHRLVCLSFTLINGAWLLPIAFASQHWPAWSFWLALGAYVPLVILAVRLGAGRSVGPT